ncbi:MAG: hypothetical protein RLZ28_1408 [Actinomycetota bacterium]
MIRVKNLRIVTIAIVASGIIGVNLAAFTSSGDPFTSGNTVFEVKKYVGDSDWIENAPIVLAGRFKHVRLVNVRSDYKAIAESDAGDVVGFSVQKEIVDIFGGVDADFSDYPLDFRSTQTGLNFENLKPYQFRLPWGGYEAEVRCVPATAKDCTLAMFWNKTTVRRHDDATFIGVRLSDSAFALIEKHLFEQLNVVKPIA